MNTIYINVDGSKIKKETATAFHCGRTVRICNLLNGKENAEKLKETLRVEQFKKGGGCISTSMVVSTFDGSSSNESVDVIEKQNHNNKNFS